MRLGVYLATIVSLLLLCTAWAQPKSGGGATAGEFDKLMKQWTGLVRELREIQLEFRVAKEDQRDALYKSFQEKMAQASAMIPKLATAGEAAYTANPRDEQLRDFMLQLALASRQVRDDFNEAMRLCKLLIANIETIPEDKRPSLYAMAAMAAFELGQLDEARKYLKSAGDTPEVKQQRELLEEEIKYWKEEQEKVAAEAKADNLPRVEIVTNRGPLVVELFENEAPNTVANFIHLVESGYYKGKTFHRVVPGFVIQGGAKNEDGTGGPGWQIACECYGDKFRRHYRGYLSMALSGKDTGGAQFFICLSRLNTRSLDRTFLPDGKPDKGHTVFGRVVKGMELLAEIQRRDPSKAQDQPIKPDRIVSAKVIRKTKGKEYVPKKIGDEEEKEKSKEEKKSKAKEEGKKAAAKKE